MPLKPVELITEPTYQAMRFDGTVQSATEGAWAIQTALTSRLLVRADIEAFQEGNNAPEWRITLRRPDDTEVQVYAGYWIVVWSTGLIETYDDASYRAKFTLPEGEQ
jgi:hypothetical protein